VISVTALAIVLALSREIPLPDDEVAPGALPPDADNGQIETALHTHQPCEDTPAPSNPPTREVACPV
ncbi:MAG: hypothetical protein ACF8PG_08005, partial [Maioricimonas sp. JB045]